LNPHPRRSSEGHSYGKKEERPKYIPPDRWKENKLYLFGIDLYHQGYLWESHELWESLWHLVKKEDPEGQFLQGLIQNSAAQLKLQIKEISGAARLSREAWRRLKFVFDSGVADEKGRFMGIDVRQLLDVMESHYRPLWEKKGKVFGDAPRLCPL
jgi:predicted metal-dependent hydrolase